MLGQLGRYALESLGGIHAHLRLSVLKRPHQGRTDYLPILGVKPQEDCGVVPQPPIFRILERSQQGGQKRPLLLW